MKKLIALLLATIMVASMAACAPAKEETKTPAAEKEESSAAKEETPAEEEEATDDIKIAGIVFQDDQFMNMMTKGFVDAAADAGVEILTDNTNNDQARETELINTYVGQEVDGLAIAPLSADASTAALKRANEDGMEVTLTNIDVKGADFIAGGFTSDDYTNTSLVGAEAAKMIKEKFGDETIQVAVIQFAVQLPEISANRVKGYTDALEAAGVSYEIVADQDAWMQDTALEAASGILTANPDLDVIITVNDGGTIGSTMAVTNAGMADKVMVFGHDGSDQISAFIMDENSPLKAVIAQDPYGQGYQAVTTLVAAIRGEDVSATKGKCTYLDGIVLSANDRDGVNAWRVDNGLEEIK